MSVTIFLAALASQAAGPVAAPVIADVTSERTDVAYGQLSKGRNLEAIAALRAAVGTGDDPAALINLGTAYARVGEVEKARECFAAAMASSDRYSLELADGRWVDSRDAAKMAMASLQSDRAFASR